MPLVMALTLTPFKAYVGLLMASLMLVLGFRRRPEAQSLSAWLSFSAFAIVFLFADVAYFQDYQSYLDWLSIADVRLAEHMDKGFGAIMVALSALSTSPWIWLGFVLSSIAALLTVGARMLRADCAIFFLLLLANPRVQEFYFNSTRAALSMTVLMLAATLWLTGRRWWGLLVALLGLSLHNVIGGACLLVLLGAAFLPMWSIVGVFALGSGFLLLGIYPDALYAWPREQLTAFVLLTKGSAIDEYLFDAISGNLWMKFSMWMYCSSVPALSLCYFRELDETGQRLVKGSLALAGIALFFMALVPIIARLHLLACLLAALALARSHAAEKGRVAWLIGITLLLGTISVFRNLSFIALT